MEDNDNVVNNIKSSVSVQSILIIFHDLIGSPSLKTIANLFTKFSDHTSKKRKWKQAFTKYGNKNMLKFISL